MASESLSFSSLSEGSCGLSPVDQESEFSSSPLLQHFNQSLRNSGIICMLCNHLYSSPKVLQCLHSFCSVCLETYIKHCEFPTCPVCKADIFLPKGGVSCLPPDYVVENVIKSFPSNSQCHECKRETSQGVARCIHCSRVICQPCLSLHNFNECSEIPTCKVESEKEILAETKCLLHTDEELNQWCFGCEELACNKCIETEHSDPLLHRCEVIDSVSSHLLSSMHQTLAEWQIKLSELSETSRFNTQTLQSLSSQFSETLAHINDTYAEFRTILAKHYKDQIEILEQAYSTMYTNLEDMSAISRKTCTTLSHACEFYTRLFKNASLTQCLLFKSQMDVKNKIFSGFTSHRITGGFRYAPNFKMICSAVSNTFGVVTPHIEDCGNAILPPVMLSNNYADGFSKIAHQMLSMNPYNAPPAAINYPEKKSKLKLSNSFDSNSSYSILDMGTPKINLPMKSFITRIQMTYSWKFGAYGSLEGQFTEPNGVAMNRDDDIVIADTNNNRVQLFNKFGKFKYQFGCVPTVEGNLLFPNRVAVTTGGDVVVTERAPTHQVQVYNQYGQFVRKFGSDVLHYPRAVAVDSDDFIIIVECRIMRVVIFDQTGKLVHQFSCIPNLQFPNGVAVRNREIFISDNRSHCVMVYDYDGNFRRQIGCEGLTNYPIGVLIGKDGSVLIADNHNNFNLTVFTPEGQLIAAYESKVKHSQCYDVAMSPSGILALTCKDFHVYLYQYPAQIN